MRKQLRHGLATVLGTVGIWLLSAAAHISPETAQVTFEDEPKEPLPEMQEVANRIHRNP